MAKGRNGPTPSRPTGENKDTLEIPVHYGGFSAGDETCRLGVLIDRENMSLKQAERLLCGAQLQVYMTTDPNSNGDVAGQQKLIEDAESIQGVADVHHFSVGPKRITSGLTFKLGSVDPSDILTMSKRQGRIKCVRIGNAEERKRGRPAAEDTEEDEG